MGIEPLTSRSGGSSNAFCSYTCAAVTCLQVLAVSSLVITNMSELACLCLLMVTCTPCVSEAHIRSSANYNGTHQV